MVIPERRWLDGIVVGVRKDANGNSQDICLTDMTIEELDNTLNKYSSDQKDTIIRHLNRRLAFEGGSYNATFMGMDSKELEAVLRKYTRFQKDAIIRYLVRQLRNEGDKYNIRYAKLQYFR